jgi:hypothetical protein
MPNAVDTDPDRLVFGPLLDFGCGSGFGPPPHPPEFEKCIFSTENYKAFNDFKVLIIIPAADLNLNPDPKLTTKPDPD